MIESNLEELGWRSDQDEAQPPTDIPCPALGETCDLILPGEQHQEFEQMFRAWLDAYQPSTQEAMFLVRETCTAQWLLLRQRRRYNYSEQQICRNQPDPTQWTDAQHKAIERARRSMQQAERQFHRAFAVLEGLRKSRVQQAVAIERTRVQDEKSQSRPAPSKAGSTRRKGSDPEETVAPAPDATASSKAGQLFQGQNSPKKRKKVHTLEQWVEVTVENGQTTTRLFPSNKNLIEHGKKMWPSPDLVYRRINFPDGVPPEYAWVGIDSDRVTYGGCGVQRMTPDTWLEVIAREAPEIPQTGYRSSIAPGHIGPTGVGNLPRPAERGQCECSVCLPPEPAGDEWELIEDTELVETTEESEPVPDNTASDLS